MLVNPRPGDRVQLRYRASLRSLCPHGATGTIVVAGKGKPRNHLVRLDDGRELMVPCGHITKLK
jgi:hypothetical protein